MTLCCTTVAFLLCESNCLFCFSASHDCTSVFLIENQSLFWNIYFFFIINSTFALWYACQHKRQHFFSDSMQEKREIFSQQLTPSFPKPPLVDNSMCDQTLAFKLFLRAVCMCAVQICEVSQTTELLIPEVVPPELSLCKGGQSLDLKFSGTRICSRATCFALGPCEDVFSQRWCRWQHLLARLSLFFLLFSRQQVIMACRSPLLMHCILFPPQTQFLHCSTRVPASHSSQIQFALTQAGVIKPGCSTWKNRNNNHVHIRMSYLQIMFVHVAWLLNGNTQSFSKNSTQVTISECIYLFEPKQIVASE